MAEHEGALVGLRADLAGFRTMTDRRFDAIDQRFEKLEEKMTAGFDKMAAGFRWLTVLMVMIFGVMLTAYVALAATIAVM